jgi:phosphatidate cytidylyltransferase
MMSPAQALNDPIFRAYLLIVPISIACGGAILALLQFGFRKNLGEIWSTYRSWIGMAAIGLLFVFIGRVAVIVGVTLLSILAFKEFARASQLNRDRWMTAAGYIGIIAIGVVSSLRDLRLFLGVPLFFIPVILLIPIARNLAEGELQKVGQTIIGFICIGWMFGHLGYLANSLHSYGFVCYVIFATELSDVSAFTCGRLFGRHPLRSVISPRKTVEGALGAIAVAMILPWVFRFSFPFFSATQLILIGLIVGLGGLFGDLTVSMIKRDLGTKDMGDAIPGHGGILDRIDSLIYVAPLFMHMANYYSELQ